MDILESKNDLTVVIDGESVTMDVISHINDKTVVDAKDEEEKKLVRDKLPDKYITIDEAPSFACQSHIHFEISSDMIGEVIGGPKREVVDHMFGYISLNPEDEYRNRGVGETLNNMHGRKPSLELTYSGGEIDIEPESPLGRKFYSEGLPVSETVSPKIKYNYNSFDSSETGDSVIVSDEQYNRVFRKVDDSFYGETLLLAKDGIRWEMIFYIEQETRYSTPYTRPRNFDEKTFNVKMPEEYTRKVSDQVSYSELSGEFYNKEKSEVAEEIRDHIRKMRDLEVTVSNDSWDVTLASL